MDKGFNISIRYHGMDYMVKIEDPSEPLKDIIEKLAYNMGVPRYDRHNNPVTHSLERKVGTVKEALRTQVNGEDKSLLDYNVKSGDKLSLITYGIGIAYGVYPVRTHKYKISWMDLIELKNLYAFLGLFFGLPIAIFGLFLFLMGVTADPAWRYVIFGFESTITNATPGVALFIAGLLIIWVTKYSWRRKH